MTWLGQLAVDHLVSTLILVMCCGAALGFALGVLYAHGSERRIWRRENKRIIDDIKANRATLPRGKK